MILNPPSLGYNVALTDSQTTDNAFNYATQQVKRVLDIPHNIQLLLDYPVPGERLDFDNDDSRGFIGTANGVPFILSISGMDSPTVRGIRFETPFMDSSIQVLAWNVSDGEVIFVKDEFWDSLDPMDMHATAATISVALAEYQEVASMIMDAATALQNKATEIHNTLSAWSSKWGSRFSSMTDAGKTFFDNIETLRISGTTSGALMEYLTGMIGTARSVFEQSDHTLGFGYDEYYLPGFMDTFSPINALVTIADVVATALMMIPSVVAKIIGGVVHVAAWLGREIVEAIDSVYATASGDSQNAIFSVSLGKTVHRRTSIADPRLEHVIDLCVSGNGCAVSYLHGLTLFHYLTAVGEVTTWYYINLHCASFVMRDPFGHYQSYRDYGDYNNLIEGQGEWFKLSLDTFATTSNFESMCGAMVSTVTANDLITVTDDYYNDVMDPTGTATNLQKSDRMSLGLLRNLSFSIACALHASRATSGFTGLYTAFNAITDTGYQDPASPIPFSQYMYLGTTEAIKAYINSGSFGVQAQMLVGAGLTLTKAQNKLIGDWSIILNDIIPMLKTEAENPSTPWGQIYEIWWMMGSGLSLVSNTVACPIPKYSPRYQPPANSVGGMLGSVLSYAVLIAAAVAVTIVAVRLTTKFKMKLTRRNAELNAKWYKYYNGELSDAEYEELLIQQKRYNFLANIAGLCGINSFISASQISSIPIGGILSGVISSADNISAIIRDETTSPQTFEEGIDNLKTDLLSGINDSLGDVKTTIQNGVDEAFDEKTTAIIDAIPDNSGELEDINDSITSLDKTVAELPNNTESIRDILALIESITI